MAARIEGRDTYVNTRGKSQTIKFCDCRNLRGEYEFYYRIRPINDDYKSTEVMEEKLDSFHSLDRAHSWLKAIGAVDELNEQLISAPEHSEDPLPETSYDAEVQNRDWLENAIRETELVIDELLMEFVKEPYHHRVEHCLHTRIIQLLNSKPTLNKQYELGKLNKFTKQIHKEWPTSVAETGKRKGNHDVAIHSSESLNICGHINDFLEGRVPAPIVIEVGLDYGPKHLQGDCQKLKRQTHTIGYLIHLVRGRSMNQEEKNIIDAVQKGDYGAHVRIAYAFIHRKKTYKTVNGVEQCDD